MRSLATHRQHLATSAVLGDVLRLVQSADFDLVIVETAGIGQSDTEIVDLVDLSLYVLTADYGAASQLEKIDMLDFADFIALNKYEKQGAEDALRDVRRQVARNRKLFELSPEQLPVYPTIASQFNDAGVNTLFAALCARLHAGWGQQRPWLPVAVCHSAAASPCHHPGERVGCRDRCGRARVRRRAGRRTAASRAQGLWRALGSRRPGAPACRSVADSSLPRRSLARPTAAGVWPRPADIGDGNPALLREWPARVRRRRRMSIATGSATARSQAPTTPSRCRGCGCRRSPCRRAATGANSSHSCWRRIYPAPTPTPEASIRIGGRTRIRRGCSPARACRSAPTGASITWRASTVQCGCRRPSIRSRCTVRIRTNGRTSTGASATRACRSRRSTT